MDTTKERNTELTRTSVTSTLEKLKEERYRKMLYQNMKKNRKTRDWGTLDFREGAQ